MKVSIYREPAFGGISIMIYEKQPSGRVAVARPVGLVFKEKDPNTVVHIEPTLRLEPEIADALLKAFAEALDSEGIKTDKDAKIEGTLEATRVHLEDMRKLVFNPPSKDTSPHGDPTS